MRMGMHILCPGGVVSGQGSSAACGKVYLFNFARKSTAKIHESPILFWRAVEDARGGAQFVPRGSCQRSRLVGGMRESVSFQFCAKNRPRKFTGVQFCFGGPLRMRMGMHILCPGGVVSGQGSSAARKGC